MTAVFLKILNMSITAGWIVLAVMLLRLFLKKMPKQLTCMLWALVGIRLIFPFSIESVLSLIPSAKTVPETLSAGEFPEIHSGIAVVDRVVNPAAKISFSYLSTGHSGAEALNFITKGAVILWLTGMCLMFCYLIFSYLHLSKKLQTAVRFTGQSLLCCPAYHNIWQSEFVDSPFILGLINPRIYIPYHLSGEALTHVLAHENAHLARKDHLVKAFAFCLLSVYWFHPLLWAAYMLLCRDIELACDERVLQNYNEEAKKDYLLSLIGYEKTAVNIPAPACPLAFGEVDIKERILRAKTWKKPALALIASALLLCAAAALCLLTDPKEELLTAPEPFGHAYQVEAITYEAPQYDFSFTPETAPLYVLTSGYQLMESINPLTTEKPEGYWVFRGAAEKIRLTEKMLTEYLTVYDTSVMSDISLSSIVKENKKTWIVNRPTGYQQQIFYYIMLQKNGDVYLSYGYDNEENVNIRWIFKLSVMEEKNLSAETLYSWRTKYIGNNSAVGNIIYNLNFPQDMTYKQFALQTDSEPYEVTVTFSLSEEDKRQYTEDAPNRQDELILLKRNAYIMFALIQNAKIVNYELIDETDKTKTPVKIVYTRQKAEFETGCNLWHESSIKEQFEALLVILQERLTP